MKKIMIFMAGMMLFFVAGCGVNYTTPGPAANFSEMDEQLYANPASQNNGGKIVRIEDYQIRKQFESKPAANFPANVVAVRVQGNRYSAYNCDSYGKGKYSIITARTVEQESDYEKVSKMAGVDRLGTLNRLLLPRDLNSVHDLRQAAAGLHADLLLLYTFDTSFRIDSQEIGPLGIITLGLLPNKSAKVTTTASAVIYDVRTGYIYGLAEASDSRSNIANAWSTEEAIDSARIHTERQAFSKLVDELAKTWNGILGQYAMK